MSRVGIVGFFHETNTYSPRRTRYEDFARFELLMGREIPERHFGTGSVIAGFLETTDPEPIPLFSARAWPGGLVDRGTADELLAKLETQLQRVPDLDGVLISLHGAMVAEGYPDMELEVLQRIRSIHGSAPVAAVLDLHGIPRPVWLPHATC